MAHLANTDVNKSKIDHEKTDTCTYFKNFGEKYRQKYLELTQRFNDLQENSILDQQMLLQAFKEKIEQFQQERERIIAGLQEKNAMLQHQIEDLDEQFKGQEK